MKTTVPAKIYQKLFISLGEESNPQQSYYKYDVLPLNYLSKDSPVEIRTPTKGTKNLCATVTPPENNKNIIPLKQQKTN
jgi:hypothetical protein